MTDKEVVPAFDMLLEELETIIPELNNQGKKLMDEMEYTEAKKIIAKAEAVIAFQGKVRSLKDEWVQMEVPATKIVLKQPIKKQPGKKIKRVTTTKLKEGKRTRNEEFRMPILQELVEAGGSLSFSKLISQLEKTMRGQFTEDDLKSLPSDGKTIRWINNVGWAKKPLLDAGYLSDTAPKGTWEITDAGRDALAYSKKKA